MAQARGKYKNWNKNDLDKALQSTREGSSYGEASKIYGISRQTLYSRIKMMALKSTMEKNHHLHIMRKPNTSSINTICPLCQFVTNE